MTSKWDGKYNKHDSENWITGIIHSSNCNGWKTVNKTEGIFARWNFWDATLKNSIISTLKLPTELRNKEHGLQMWIPHSKSEFENIDIFKFSGLIFCPLSNSNKIESAKLRSVHDFQLCTYCLRRQVFNFFHFLLKLKSISSLLLIRNLALRE